MPQPRNYLATAKAPGKIILSGEHSVVYGAPAIATTVGYFAACTASISSKSPSLVIQLRDFDLTKQLSWEDAYQRYLNLDTRYQQYLGGNLNINQVADINDDLVIYALINTFGKELYGYALNLTVEADIPIGAGMGSSAAITAAVLKSVEALLPEKTITNLQKSVHQVENIQHGKSSGLDPAVICNGGLCYWHDGNLSAIDVINRSPLNQWFIVKSGLPESSTGESVDAVKQQFSQSSIWSEFAKVTKSFGLGLTENNPVLLQDSIRQNHQLLCDIGVVPNKVKQAIQNLQQQGFAAKISGAGSVSGDNAGMVLIYSEDGLLPPNVFGQRPQILDFYPQGVHIDT